MERRTQPPSVRALDAVALTPHYARRTRSIIIPPNDITSVRDARSALLGSVARAVGPIERDGRSLCEKDGGKNREHRSNATSQEGYSASTSCLNLSKFAPNHALERSSPHSCLKASSTLFILSETSSIEIRLS
jgi:hypothetical protein